ncbi:MAG: beta-lactamase family protein [Bacteroidales bacterium]|nr:beta-lactamase family protein [Bacteroidales bacterium]
MGIYGKFGLSVILIVFIIVTAITLNSGSNSVVREQPKISDTNNYSYNKTFYSKLISDYDTFIRNSTEAEHLPGLALVIVKDNQILFIKGYGVREYGGNDSIDLNTVFRLGSVSKGFASVLTGILVNDKKLSWNDHIIKYLPDFTLKNPDYTKQLTIRHILSHTSGLPMHTYTNMLDYDVPYDQIKPLISLVDPVGPPGKEYSYQNVIYSLIGDVVYSATDQDYQKLIYNKIFIPLNMQRASIDFESISKDSNVAFPHLYAGQNLWRSQKLNGRYYTVAPASGVNASISDMARWLIALLGNYPEFIPDNALEEVFSPQISTPVKRKFRHSWKDLGNLYYGLGWRIFETCGKKIIYHGGYVRGYRAEIALDLEEKVGIAVLFNCNCKLANKCIPEFWELYFSHSSENSIIALKN